MMTSDEITFGPRGVYAVTVTPGIRFMTKFAAVVAFGWPTSAALAQVSINVCARCIPEEKLSIQIRDVDGIHVDDVDIFESR
jgi:hypothetical protein